MTETQCGRCGDCCDPVITTWPLEHVQGNAERWLSLPDPGTHPDLFDLMLRRIDPDADLERARVVRAASIANATFLAKHWQPVGEPDGDVHRWRCDAFDPQSRLCTAHDARPPICSGFP